MSYRNQRSQYNRFENFQEFADGKGFTIEEEDRTIEFFYDHLKGFFDEQGKYYDKNGIFVQNPSKESLKFWDTIKDEYAQDDLVNDYERGLSGHGSDEDDGQDDDYPQERKPYRGNDNRYPDSRRQVPDLSRRDDTKRVDTQPKVEAKKIEFKKTEVRTAPKQQEVKQERQEPKREEAKTQQPQQQQKVVVQSEPTAKKPELVGNQVTVTITGLGVSEPEQTFFKWLLDKIDPINFVSQRSREEAKGRTYKFVFADLSYAEDALKYLKVDETGKVAYKGKYGLVCKIEKS